MTTADKLRAAAARRWGYQVKGAGFDKTHYTITFKAALEWAACYPSATVTRKGQFIASKTTREAQR